jgi:hypothetical protein
MSSTIPLPHANRFVIVTAVLNTHAQGCTKYSAGHGEVPEERARLFRELY